MHLVDLSCTTYQCKGWLGYKASFSTCDLLTGIFIIFFICFCHWPFLSLTVLLTVFSIGYSCFLDVDFALITQTMRHSVNCQRLIWPVGLMGQLIRALIGSLSERGKDFIGIKIWGQRSIHFSNQPLSSLLSFPHLAKLFPEVFQYGLHWIVRAVVIQGEIKLFKFYWLRQWERIGKCRRTDIKLEVIRVIGLSFDAHICLFLPLEVDSVVTV